MKSHSLIAFLLVLCAVQSANAQPGKRRKPKPPPFVPPTLAEVRYGAHERNVMDVWQVDSAKPAPVLVAIHGGAFRHGDKSVSNAVLKGCLNSGIAVVAITYRYSQDAIAPAQHLDAARAVQFIRHNSGKWNLDPGRIAAIGGSAGAGLSLWLGFHADLADPNSKDPIARQSTRLTCMAVNNGQSSYDPRVIRDLFPEAEIYRTSALAQLFGVDLKRLDELPAEKYQLFEEVSAITHLTEDDPPVLMTYDSDMETPISSNSIGIHHPRFGKLLKDNMDQLHIECQLLTGFRRTKQSRSKQVLKFVRRHFGISDQ